MVKLINPMGGITWVHESRVDEYLKAGYQHAPPPPPPVKKKPTRKQGG